MFVLDDEDFEEQLRSRREVPPQSQLGPQVQGQPIQQRRADNRPLEYFPVPPVADLESAGSDAYGHHGGYKPGRVRLLSFCIGICQFNFAADNQLSQKNHEKKYFLKKLFKIYIAVFPGVLYVFSCYLLQVGPVYTFVKTDPYAHVKWGVRHVVGKQYAGH